jgi:hypothetical protein
MSIDAVIKNRYRDAQAWLSLRATNICNQTKIVEI